jgi:hypothetical protein
LPEWKDALWDSSTQNGAGEAHPVRQADWPSLVNLKALFQKCAVRHQGHGAAVAA